MDTEQLNILTVLLGKKNHHTLLFRFPATGSEIEIIGFGEY